MECTDAGELGGRTTNVQLKRGATPATQASATRALPSSLRYNGQGLADIYIQPYRGGARRIGALIEKEILQQLDELPLEQQRQVLDFARALARRRPTGVPGSELLRFAGTIEHTDLQLMAEAIETGCK